jgi:ABC-type amino acid transport substrate-binding protein
MTSVRDVPVASIFKRAALCGLLLLAASAARSEPRVYIDRVAPLAYSVNGVQQGLLHDLMSEMARRAQYAGAITPMPLLRQRFLISSHDDAIGTIWRMAENEDKYRWWCKLFEFSFVMVAAPGSSADISSIEAAKDLRVGVILGSPAEDMARRSGFRNIQTANNAVANLGKLELGRIDIWIAAPLVLKATEAEAGRSLAALRIGKPVGKIGLYLASSHNFDARQGEKWKAAFGSMQKDGSYAQIMKKYGVPFDETEHHAAKR